MSLSEPAFPYLPSAGKDAHTADVNDFDVAASHESQDRERDYEIQAAAALRLADEVQGEAAARLGLGLRKSGEGEHKTDESHTKDTNAPKTYDNELSRSGDGTVGRRPNTNGTNQSSRSSRNKGSVGTGAGSSGNCSGYGGRHVQ